MTVALDMEVQIERRAVNGTNYGLRLAGAVEMNLLSSLKRYNALRSECTMRSHPCKNVPAFGLDISLSAFMY